ncbi:MAG: YtxH domain-containing protein [Rubrobacter sp.]|nr:YtxH domain-containing protein [Rubrobacter sp.]
MLDKGRLRTFLIGGAAGLLAGVLLAPRSGRELRGSLSNRAGEARERGRESYFEAQEGMRDRVAASREVRRPRPGPEPEEPPANTAAAGPHLRDVSSGVEPSQTEDFSGEAFSGEAERSEELRRKVRETRERLRDRRDLGQGPEE